MIQFKKNAKFQTWVILMILLPVFSLEGCKSNNSSGDKDLQNARDSIAFQDSLAMASEQKLPDLTVNKPIISKNIDKNFEANKAKIEKKYGNQWDFCRCIIMNDSLDQLIKKGAELDDAFMTKFDEVDQKCKAFLTMSPNQTPDERKLHEQKIRECLKK
ncbi:MAG: hypothetical protein KJ941_01860 [Bacteroidetes bacterium]|nr:hypothetical protein [Bacteroidota bacterium]